MNKLQPEVMIKLQPEAMLVDITRSFLLMCLSNFTNKAIIRQANLKDSVPLRIVILCCCFNLIVYLTRNDLIPYLK